MNETIEGANIRNLFAKNLRRFRHMVKISQLDLAAVTGLAHNFINDIENEKKFVSDETIAKLAIALKVDPYRFFLPEEMWNRQVEDILLGDFSNSIGMIVKEHCDNYFRDNLMNKTDNDKPKKT